MTASIHAIVTGITIVTVHVAGAAAAVISVVVGRCDAQRSRSQITQGVNAISAVVAVAAAVAV